MLDHARRDLALPGRAKPAPPGHAGPKSKSPCAIGAHALPCRAEPRQPGAASPGQAMFHAWPKSKNLLAPLAPLPSSSRALPDPAPPGYALPSAAKPSARLVSILAPLAPLPDTAMPCSAKPSRATLCRGPRCPAEKSSGRREVCPMPWLYSPLSPEPRRSRRENSLRHWRPCQAQAVVSFAPLSLASRGPAGPCFILAPLAPLLNPA